LEFPVTFIASLILFASGPAEAPPDPAEKGLAVMDLNAVHGVPASLAKLLNELVLSVANSSARFSQVIGGSDMRELLDLDQQKQVMGCDDSGCIAAIGGALGVPYLLSSSLGKVGDRYVFTAKLLLVDEAKVLGRSTTMFGSKEALLDGVKDAVLGVVNNVPRLTLPADLTADIKRRSRRRIAGYSLIGLGGAVVGGAHLFFASSVGRFENSGTGATVNDWIDLAGDRRTSNIAVVVGSSFAVLGGGLWWWGR
jgi:hypothetical protein